MDASLTIGSSAFRHLQPPRPSILPSITTSPLPADKFLQTATTHRDLKFTVKAASSSSPSNNSVPFRKPNPLISHLKTAAVAVVFAAAIFAKFQQLPSKAEVSSPPTNLTEELNEDDSQTREEVEDEYSKSEAVDNLKKLLHQKLEAGEYEGSLTILNDLSSLQPDNEEWKFTIAMILTEIGKIKEARDIYADILARNPFSVEALFENALLMDRSGEGDEVMKRLEVALRIAEEENKSKEAREVKFIMAQMQYLQKNVDGALKIYDELVRENPDDFRAYFCKGMIYSLLDREEEASEQFAKYRKLSPSKIEGYLRTPLSIVKLSGNEDDKGLNSV